MATPRRIAAIDVGTNSIHMIVAEPQHGGYRVVDKEKQMVQLGLGSLNGAPLADDAIERGAAAIARMADVARGWGVEEIVAVATSAVREAPNRRDFLRRVKEAANLKLRVISGEEEADYIYRAVRSAVDLDGTALCVDIGGGSVEFIIGTASEIYFTASEPLGSLRLAEQFELQDLARPEAVAACRRFVSEHLRKIQKKVRKIGVDQSIGTSGTIQALTNIAGAAESSAAVARTLRRDALVEVVARLAGTSARERVERFAIEEKRAGTIVAGAAILASVMESLRLPSLLACPVGIREGLVEAHLGVAPAAVPGRAKRRASVTALARRANSDERHSRHVARLAMRIFDQTAPLHKLGTDRRELLEYAALLHEVGMLVSDRGYHKHTYYLVRHAALRGLTEEQLIVVANVARYHRKGEPSDEHENLTELAAEERDEVYKLAAILRIAEALDRGHRQAVRDVAVRYNGNSDVRFHVRVRSHARAEIAAAEKRARYFGGLFERRVRFKLM